MLDHFKYLLFFLFLMFLISCTSKPLMTIEDFENSLIEQGYNQTPDSKTNADKEMRALIEEKKHVPILGTTTKKNYLNFQVNYQYYFIGLTDEMINKYVVLSFTDKDGNQKIYEIKNENTEKGYMEIGHEKLSDDYYKISIENPIYYYWDKAFELEAQNKSLTMEKIESSLIKNGYEEFEIGKSKSGAEILLETFGKVDNINILYDKPLKRTFTLYMPKEKYENFTVEKQYNFIGYDNKMTNKYVTVLIWGKNKDNEYVCKGYEKKNIKNQKGRSYKLKQSLKDIDGKIITNPILYLWE